MNIHKDFRIYVTPVPKRGDEVKYYRVVAQRLIDGVSKTSRAATYSEVDVIAEKLCQILAEK